MDNPKIKNFTDLIAWQESHKVVLQIYKITDNFPQKEIYNLTSQMRRAAVSITSNIAEGFSRKSRKEKTQFYYLSLGSLTELENQLTISRDVGYIDNKTLDDVLILLVNSRKLINGLIKSAKAYTKY